MNELILERLMQSVEEILAIARRLEHRQQSMRVGLEEMESQEQGSFASNDPGGKKV